MTTPRRLATVREIAAAYRVTPRTVYRWVADGAIEAVQCAPRKALRIVDDEHLVFAGPDEIDDDNR